MSMNDFESIVKRKGYGIGGKLWQNSQGQKGYICGFDCDDGCYGYMNVLNEAGDDISDKIVGVDLSCIKPVEEVSTPSVTASTSTQYKTKPVPPVEEAVTHPVNPTKIKDGKRYNANRSFLGYCYNCNGNGNHEPGCVNL